jgi:hypothetical protein
MDLSIRLITPEVMRERGAAAFDAGLGQDDHGMNESAPARKDWQYGWHARRIECARAQQAGQQLAEACPP